ncbi:pyrimidine dimer DNA glycosylase/endonuclease V [Pseudodesulfovibrio sp.]|uniref:pyrimidine dimer DNA glycosylase/endonuclease V n=1 Tax=Pseudodesulfovibrio sp. TaxID=2035812 RepID=UPI0026209A94|nr:pyrimidine dimer DNA glycosylase/endonuclease V [Pseudodesulfovibrio sp.]MDD3312710.1 pyrimidine dimer DNA glycosylase/endonuclease V [Pseudodesulfovibrio sp.]
MRLWTVHPRYLDVKGLTAVWREGLLARAVLLGRTRGYVNHPQLVRFRAAPDPVAAVNAYLAEVLAESRRRGYRFNASLVDQAQAAPMAETEGQLAYEWAHLLRKLADRAPDLRRAFAAVDRPDPHPLFTLVPGPVRDWEKR